MADDVRAVVQSAPGTFEIRTFPRPAVGPDDTLVRIEACGICGTDVETFSGRVPLRGAVVPGHEPVGIVDEIGADAAARWGLAVGDRVVVQAELGCGRCLGCLDQGPCAVTPGNHGFVPVDRAPGLWGGFAELLFLGRGSVPFPVAASVPPRRAALFNLLGAGFAWAVGAAGLTVGDTIAVLGPGQRGLGCVVAAREAGAGLICVTGRGSTDAHKLALAGDLGADVVVDVERDDAVAAVLAATGGRGVDAVVDTTPHAHGPVRDAVAMVRPGGTVVLAGLKGPAGVDGFPTDEVAVKTLTVRGVRGVDRRAFRRAVALIEADRHPLDRLHTHHYPLDAAAEAVGLLAEPGSGAIAVTVEP